jgi:hypothetical protein
MAVATNAPSAVSEPAGRRPRRRTPRSRLPPRVLSARPRPGRHERLVTAARLRGQPSVTEIIHGTQTIDMIYIVHIPLLIYGGLRTMFRERSSMPGRAGTKQIFRRLRGRARVLSALVGASVVVAMGAVTVAPTFTEASASTPSTHGWTSATVTQTPPQSAPETSLAAPTVTANPWQGKWKP